MLTERIMHECIKKLLRRYPDPEEEDVEALCKLMSTIGEMIDHSKAKEHMDYYFQLIDVLSNNMNLSSRVRFMLRDSIDQRSNKWQERRKVDGLKKIEEVHRDAAHERQSQTNRFSHNPSSNPSPRRPPMLSPPSPQMGSFRGTSPQGHGGGYQQDIRFEERHSSMNWNAQDRSMIYANRPLAASPASQGQGPALIQNLSAEKLYSEDRLRDMSMAVIKEFYSARDEKEVALCIKDLNSPSFHPSMISLWVNDSFERKDKERDLLASLLVSLTRSHDGVLNQLQLIKGFESVLTTLEDAVNDAPKAPEFLGSIFAKVVLENVVSLIEIGQLLREGGEERGGSLLEFGLAGDVLGNTLEKIKSEKGEVFLNDIRSSSSLRVEDFQPPIATNRSRILEKFAINRFSHNPTSNPSPRRPPMLSPPSPQMGSFRGTSPQGRGGGYPQDIRFEERHSSMNWNAQDRSMIYANRPLTASPASQGQGPALIQNLPAEKLYSEDRLRDMCTAAIKEFYSARDEKEVALCIKDLNSPSFHPSMISLWVNDSFERKDKERDLLASLLVSLTRSHDGVLNQLQLIKGFESVLTTLEDAVNDAPKAPEFLGSIFAKVVLENVVSLIEIGQLLREGGEERGSLLEFGLAGDVLGNTLEKIKSEKGEVFLNDIRSSSSLRVEDFQPPIATNRSRILEKFAINRFSHNPTSNPSPRRPPMLSPPSSQMGSFRGTSPQGRGGGYPQDIRFEERHSSMNWNAQDRSMIYANRPLTASPASQGQGPALIQNLPAEKLYSEDRLRDMSTAAIKEFYSARDEKEVALCIKDLNSPSFHPSMISLWVNDSFERKDKERDLLASLLVSLTRSHDGVLNQLQLIKGFESVLTTLEDAVNDAPKAPEFLGSIFAKVVLENVVSLIEIGQLLREGGEERGSLLEFGLAGDVLGNTLEKIKSEKGEVFLNDICSSSSLRVEDFQSPIAANRSRILEKSI